MVGCREAKRRTVAAVGKKTVCAAEEVKLSWVRLEQTFDRSQASGGWKGEGGV